MWILGLIAFKVFWFTFTFLPQPFSTDKSLGVVFLYFVWIALTNLTKCTCPTENNKKRSTPKIWHKFHLNNYCGDYCWPPIVLWSGYCLDCKTVGFYPSNSVFYGARERRSRKREREREPRINVCLRSRTIIWPLLHSWATHAKIQAVLLSRYCSVPFHSVFTNIRMSLGGCTIWNTKNLPPNLPHTVTNK